MYKIGDTCYFLESNIRVLEGIIHSSSGGKYVIQYGSGKGIRHFLMITGDPVPSADRSQITPVFDYNSIRFMNMAKLMNDEVFSDDRIIYGGALNYHGKNVS